MKCEHCGDTVKPNCDWRQGRCPHRPAMIDIQALINSLKGKIVSWLQKSKKQN